MFTISILIPFVRSHKNSNYEEKTISDLLGEVKVSSVTSIPCIVKGEIIGRGTPGYILSEDFIINCEFEFVDPDPNINGVKLEDIASSDIAPEFLLFLSII